MPIGCDTRFIYLNAQISNGLISFRPSLSFCEFRIPSYLRNSCLSAGCLCNFKPSLFPLRTQLWQTPPRRTVSSLINAPAFPAADVAQLFRSKPWWETGSMAKRRRACLANTREQGGGLGGGCLVSWIPSDLCPSHYWVQWARLWKIIANPSLLPPPSAHTVL